MQRYTITVSKVQHGARLQDIIMDHFPLITSRSAVKKAFKRKQIFLNGVEAFSYYKVCDGDQVELRIRIPEGSKQLDLNIIYEDEYLIFINKPPGILTSGHGKVSIASELISMSGRTQEVDALPYPLLTHRLDRDTAGVLIAAKTVKTRRELGDMFAGHDIVKYYVAVVEGTPRIQSIEEPIDSKKARTDIVAVQCLETRDTMSCVLLKIYSGRTHQIRKHMLGIGCPIVGDTIYNRTGLGLGRGLHLQAYAVSMKHPILDTELRVQCDLHKKFRKIGCKIPRVE